MTFFVVLYTFHLWEICNQMLIANSSSVFTFCYQLI